MVIYQVYGILQYIWAYHCVLRHHIFIHGPNKKKIDIYVKNQQKKVT